MPKLALIDETWDEEDYDILYCTKYRSIENRERRFRPDDSDYESTARYSDGMRRIRYQRDWSNPNTRL